MSNSNIIASIRTELEAFERNERTADQLEGILFAHFGALEGVPYSRLKILHDFEARLVKAQFADEDPGIEASGEVISRLRIELEEIQSQEK